ncbi:MAG: hypothetical protein WA972_12730 [Rhodococcus qingshengii]
MRKKVLAANTPSEYAVDSSLEIVADLESQLLGQAIELEEILESYSALVDQLDYLARLNSWLQYAGADPSQRPTVPTPKVPTPVSLAEAISFAEEQLCDRLYIHPQAARSVDEIDTSLNSRPWAQMSMLAFKALHSYAESLSTGCAHGSFWTWCESSMSPHAWLASQKKLAMGESRQLMDNRRLRAFRQLPISREVVESGLIEMTNHIKIAEGGSLAPRIYFHIDPPSATVHVGFIGPHKLMPNTHIGKRK